MAVRFFSALGWISAILAFITFFIAYASYPDEVLVYINNLGEPVQYLSKDLLFYLLLAFIIVMNAMLRVLRGMLERSSGNTELSRSGIGITQIFFNLFFATSIYFISILNSRENFNYSNFGYLIYVSGGLLSLAILFTLFSRFVVKK